jgi:hypothetical protein
MTDTLCGFAAVNQGKHCVIGDHCVVCRAPATMELKNGEIITVVGLGPLDGRYRIAGLFEGTLKLELVK